MRYHDYVRLQLDKSTKTEADMFEEVKQNDWQVSYKAVMRLIRDNPIKTEPFEGWNQCPKCGIKLEGVMGYCCANIDCPTGLGPIVC